MRDGGSLRAVSWERALEVAAGLRRHKGHVGAIVGGQATNEEGFLIQRLMREGLDSPSVDSRAGEAIPVQTARALAAPSLQATVPDIEFAHTVLVLGCEPLDDAPILDLWVRKGVRRRGVKLAVATARPSALDVNAQLVVRYPPGGEAAFIAELCAALAGDSAGEDARLLAELLEQGGDDIVILWGEQLGAAAGGLLELAAKLGLEDRDGAGLLEIPAAANGRGLREAGVLPNSGPGYSEIESVGLGAAGIAKAAHDGEITALYLFQTDPVRDLPDGAQWNRALHHAGARRRPRLGPDRGPARARQRDLPRRVLRREGGHGRPPRRPRPAPAHRDRAPRRGPRRVVGRRRHRQALRPGATSR